MEWLAYRLVYRADSPIHVGYHKLGMIQQTRHYIPGKLVWASTTARLTRALWDAPGRQKYQLVGEWVRRNLSFTYLFPALDLSFPLVPCYSDEGVCYGAPNMPKCLTSEDFEHRFIGSYASSAINTSTGTAEEGSLHEIEYLSHRDKDTGQQVMYTGAAFLKQSGLSFQPDPILHVIRCDDDVAFTINGRLVRLFRDILRQLLVGGELCYGFGLLSLLAEHSGWFDSTTQLWNYDSLSLDLSNDGRPQLNIRIGVPTSPIPVPGHLKIVNSEGYHELGTMGKHRNLKIYGSAEPFAGREWDHTSGLGVGRAVNSRGVCLSPGAVFEKTGSANSVELKLAVDYDGVLLSAGFHQD